MAPSVTPFEHLLYISQHYFKLANVVGRCPDFIMVTLGQHDHRPQEGGGYVQA